MTLVPDKLELLHQEEVDYKSGLDEFILTKLAGLNNHIANRVNKAFDWKFLGPFRPILGGEDGVRGEIWPYEIIGFTGYIRSPGSSGNTIVDIHRITGAGDQGSVLSQKLQIAFSAGAGSRFYVNLVDLSEDVPSGWTKPVLSFNQFNAGDTLRIDLDSNAIGARDLTFIAHYRPRS